MANINVVVDSPISDGSKLKFRTPCDSTVIEGLEVKYPAKNGVGTLIKKFVFKDAHGTELSGVGNLFVSGVMIEVLLDVTHGVAYIKNADTNSYVEGFKTELQRMEESQKQFLLVAGKAVERCENIADSADGFEQAVVEATKRAESVKGVYTGTGDMPDGYILQIDDSGAVFEMDDELNAESQNPVTNAAITNGLEGLRKTLEDHIEEYSGYISVQGEVIDSLSAKVDDAENAVNERLPLSGGSMTGILNTRFGMPVGEIKLIGAEHDFNFCVNGGVYYFNYAKHSNSPNGGSINGFLEVQGHHGADITMQTFYEIGSNTDTGTTVYFRKQKDNQWSEWECLNPPMVANVEYRTTERFLGKPVYTKMWMVSEGVKEINAGIGEFAVSCVVELRGMGCFEGMWKNLSGSGIGNYADLFDKIYLGDGVPTAQQWYIVMKYTKN